jgi:putative hydrolase of the HAD superfamily
MPPERRAVVFDMDDTIYPYRRFLLSGFAAVADHLESWHGVRAGAAFRVLARASRGRARGSEVQVCLRAFGLPPGLLPLLVRAIDRHEPRLRLPAATRRLLVSLREHGWQIGVLTNGPRARQARRVRALGLTALVDAIVFASEHGSGRGKPDSEPFLEILRRLGTPAHCAVFVGDDETCDVRGALDVGMQAVRCDVWTRLTDAGRFRAPTAAPLALQSFTHLSVGPAGRARRPEEVFARHVA